MKSIDEALKLVNDARFLLEQIRDDEQEAFDNMPESFQDGERGEKMQEWIDALETACNDLEAIDANLEGCK